MKMCTITINGKTYTISDADAMKKTADSNLNMNNKRITGVRLIEFGSNQGEYIAISSVSVDQETEYLILSRYYDDMKPPIIRNVSDGIEDNDVATVGQVKAVDLTAEKTLNDDQKAQARKNINAMKNGVADRDLKMNLHGIDGVSYIHFTGSTQDEQVRVRPGQGVDQDTPALILETLEQSSNPPMIRNVSDGIEVNDVATVGQINDAVEYAETYADKQAKAVDLTAVKTLTDEQKEQARRNIGAIGDGDSVHVRDIDISSTDNEGNWHGAWITPEYYVPYAKSAD